MRKIVTTALLLCLFLFTGCFDNDKEVLRLQRNQAIDNTDKAIALTEKAIRQAEYWKSRAEKCEGKDTNEVPNSGRRLGKN